jgi:hypothetical protein
MWLAAISMAIAGANTPALLPAETIAILYFAWRLRRSDMLLLIAPPWLLFIAENLIKFGSPLGSPYQSAAEHGYATILPYSGLPGFSYPLFFGIISILFSAGKGLIFFIPGLFVFQRAAPTAPPEVRLWIETLIVLLVSLVLVYSRWWAWYGGVFWGPRFFLVGCLAASLIIAAATLGGQTRGMRWIALPLVLVLSWWGCVQGYVYGLDKMDICIGNNYALEAICWYVPEFSPLWRQFVIGFAVPPLGSLSFMIWASRMVFVAWAAIASVYLLALIVRLKDARSAASSSARAGRPLESGIVP